jgi:cytochrome c biogenesis protein CcmG, thiol:disulfide interchange protein DsbE
MRTALALVLAALLATGCGSNEPGSAAPPAAQEAKQLAGAPAPLAGLHRQANELLGGGAGAFERRLDELRGYPVVVNKWASWCGPCRAEFPFFQRQSVKRGRKVAFLGVNSSDNDASAKDFLDRFPVSYPSYKDPNLEIAKSFQAVAAFPSTAFYDKRGRLASLKQGGYATEAKLAQDIDRYAH